MSDEHIMNATPGTDLFESIWVNCLFAPVAVAYVQLLIFIGNFIDVAESFGWIENANKILGYGFGTILLAGVQIASQRSKNDFIAGPIETLNIYTFFFLGMMTGGFKLALLFTILYQILEKFGLPLIVTSISANESVKAKSVGIQHRQFIFYQYIFSPLTNIIAMLIAFAFSTRLISFATITDMNLADQIKSLTIFIAMWTTCDLLLHSFYYKLMPKAGCMSIILSTILLSATYQLSKNNLAAWLFYGLIVTVGWSMTITFIRLSLQNAKVTSAKDNVKHVNFR